MRKESLEALGAVPVPDDLARELGLLPGRLEQARERLPGAIGVVARVVVDNPKPLLLVACGSYVLSSALINIVKPRGPFGAAACALVSYGLGTAISAELMKRGILDFKVRDDHGCLVPFRPGDDGDSDVPDIV
jgi:hypothetical protein